MTDDEIRAFLAVNPLPKTPAERTRAWRENMRASGRPPARAVDAAIVESQCFLMARARTMPVLVDAVDLVRVAVIALVRDGFDRDLARSVVLARLAKRDIHDAAGYMPSRKLAAGDDDVQPPKVGEWSVKDTSYIRSLAP